MSRLTARWPVLSPVRFVAAGILCIIVSRVFVILLTPGTADFPDTRLYQGMGDAVLAGVNPYDYSDDVPTRIALQTAADHELRDENWTDSLDEWNLVMSSNLPGVAVLCAGFEAIADDSRTVWRYLIILGDIAMFLGVLSLLRELRGSIADRYVQLVATFLVVANTLLVLDGTAIPEVKQFQTALMLFGAAFLVSRRPLSTLRAVGGGVVLSLSVLFMFLGAFLLPLWAVRAVREWPRLAVASAAGALIPLAGSFWLFGPGWLSTMAGRSGDEAEGQHGGATLWQLLHGVDPGLLAVLRFGSVAALVALLCLMLYRRRIDLLNWCCGLLVVFDCVYLMTGTMNRMNIAFIVAFAVLAGHRARAVAAVAAVSSAVALVAYGVALAVFPANINPWANLALVAAYFAVLLGPGSMAATAPGQVSGVGHGCR